MKNKMTVEEILKDLEKNHNCSLYEELYNRNKKRLNKVALFYRGTKVTYGEMFDKMQEYAKALKAKGVQKGDEIPLCMSNSPELVYIIGAISIVGAKFNSFGEFDKDYVTEIINGCNSDFIFVDDKLYGDIKESISDSKIRDIYMTSLTNSLPNNKDPYEELDKDFYLFRNKVSAYKAENNSIKDINEFLEQGKKYTGEIFEKVLLDDEFSITYSSGSTNSSRPKAIVHAVRSYIAMGRFHDPEVSGTPSMEDFNILAQIPPHSNTDIISSISDSLMQGSTVSLEPIYHKDFFLNSLLINKSSFVVASRCFWLHIMKQINTDLRYKNVKLPFLLAPMSAGEPLAVNEEKYLNKGLRKVKAGSDKISLPVSPITMSVAGGDCEHGGIFFALFRAIQSKRPSNLMKNQEHGLSTYRMVDIEALDKNGNYCKPGEIGRLVANSPCTMIGYKNNKEATDAFFIKDATGKTWADLKVYGYLDKGKYIHVKGRINENDKIPAFMIADEILKDTKKILSCEVVPVKDGDDELYVAHIEMQPDASINARKIMYGVESRCLNKFGKDIASKIVYRIRSNEEGFPLTGCGKRSNLALIDEGLENTFKVIVNEEDVRCIASSKYLNKEKHYNRVLKK